MGLFGRLGLGRGLLISGGRAADIVRVSGEKKQKEMTDAFNKFVDNTAPQLKTASAKQKLVSNRVKKDLSIIVNSFFKDSDLDDNIKYEIASTIYSTNGNKLSNVLTDANARKQQFAYANNGKTEGFSYLNSYIEEGSLKDVTSDRSLDQIAQGYAQEIAPMPTLDLKAKAKALGAYKETAFTTPDTDKIYQNLVASTGYMEQKPVPSGPAIGIKGTPVDKLKLEQYKQATLRTTQLEQDISTFDDKQALLKAKVANIPLNKEMLENKVELVKADVAQIDQNKRIKDLQEKRSKLALEKGKIDLEELEKKIAIGDFTMNDLLKQYKILRDDGYAMIATGFNSSTGNFILPAAKPNLIRDVQQNAFASIMKNIQRENIGNLLNSNVVSNFISLANNIPAIASAQGVTPEFGKVYVNRDGSKFIYLGPGVLQNANQEDITNIPIPR